MDAVLEEGLEEVLDADGNITPPEPPPPVTAALEEERVDAPPPRPPHRPASPNGEETVPDQSPSDQPTYIADDTLEEDVRRVIEGNDSTSQDTYRAHGTYALHTVEERFDGWNNAVREAGGDPNPENNRIPTPDLVEDLMQTYTLVGKLTMAVHQEHGTYSPHTAINRLEQWEAVAKPVGKAAAHLAGVLHILESEDYLRLEEDNVTYLSPT